MIIRKYVMKDDKIKTHMSGRVKVNEIIRKIQTKIENISQKSVANNSKKKKFYPQQKLL